MQNELLNQKIMCYYCGNATLLECSQMCTCDRTPTLSSDHVLSPNLVINRDSALGLLDSMRKTICYPDLGDITTQKMFYTLLSVVRSLAS